ncbi:MAG: glycoside hydrolase family 10 protein [Oscillospiraceae bacterium]
MKKNIIYVILSLTILSAGVFYVVQSNYFKDSTTTQTEGLQDNNEEKDESLDGENSDSLNNDVDQSDQLLESENQQNQNNDENSSNTDADQSQQQNPDGTPNSNNNLGNSTPPNNGGSGNNSNGGQTTTPPPTTPPPTTPPPTTPPPTTPPPVPVSSDMKGVWVSYLELNSLLKNKSQSQFTANINQVFANAKDLGLNTVFVHVHSHSDSYYPSAYFPWSTYVSSNANGPGFDPLAIMVQRAHSYGLKFHAWFNPYRVNLNRNNYPQLTLNAGSKPFLDPSNQQVINLLTSAVAEVVRNYNVDGVQFDDYFYATTNMSVDAGQYQNYRNSGGSLGQADWRRDNVDKLVRTTYSTIKSIKPKVKFGISPQGNNQNNYNSQFANVTKWGQSKGYVDYIAPQLYWGYEHTSAGFTKKIAEWSNIVTSVDLIIGLGPYRSGKQDSFAGSGINEWINNKNVIARQVSDIFKNSKTKGFILFDYKSMFQISGYSGSGYAWEERENLKSVLKSN